jgi:hypothetical protein
MTTSAVQSPWGQIVNDLTTASYSTFDYQPTFQLPTEKNIVFSSGDSEMLKISPKGFWVRGVQVNQDAKDFDKKWCKQVQNNHEHSIREFEARIEKTEDVELKNWITNTLPALKTHLQMLEKHADSMR